MLASGALTLVFGTGETSDFWGKEMKPYQARLERSATLPKYDIAIKPRPAEVQVI